MKSIALLTHSDWPNLSEDDQLLLEPLKQHDYDPHPVNWDKGEPVWSDYDVVVIRSAWRYYSNAERYLATVKNIEKAGVPLWNSAHVVKWSMDKHYLFELQEKGVTIVPSRLVPQTASFEDVQTAVRESDWGDFILKPVFGAGGNGLVRGNVQNLYGIQEDVRQSQHISDLLLQPMMDEVVSDGEYSFIFIGGSYSHTVKKTTAGFNTGREEGNGVVINKVDPPEDFIDQAVSMYDALPKPLLYARIDALNVKGTLHLMEAEINETRLYFSEHPAAVKQFIEALDAQASR